MNSASIQFDKSRIDAALARRLVAAQFPQWAALPVRPMAHDGWDNRSFRLGEHMTVRLPSTAQYALQVEKEHRWLPRLAPHLPLPIPVPLARGEPGEDFPWPWSVYNWIAGEIALAERIADMTGFAVAVAQFLAALQRIDVGDGPPPGRHNFFRGAPPSVYDGETRDALARLEGTIDAKAVAEVWEAALATTWEGPPVWFHGDVAFGNLLLREGRLSAVIDFGTSGVGDPACDLAIAWTMFAGESREAFRAALPLDEATWARGRGWTLWKALIMLAGATDGDQAEEHRRVIEEVLADHRHGA